MIVVDASALLEALLRTPVGIAVEERLLQAEETVHAPHLIDLEVAHVLSRYAASRRFELSRCRDALDDLAKFPLTRYAHEVMLPRIWELRHNLTAYDAAYVALAEELDARLVTCDPGIAAAGGHRAQIDLVQAVYP